MQIYRVPHNMVFQCLRLLIFVNEARGMMINWRLKMILLSLRIFWNQNCFIRLYNDNLLKSLSFILQIKIDSCCTVSLSAIIDISDKRKEGFILVAQFDLINYWCAQWFVFHIILQYQWHGSLNMLHNVQK